MCVDHVIMEISAGKLLQPGIVARASPIVLPTRAGEQSDLWGSRNSGNMTTRLGLFALLAPWLRLECRWRLLDGREKECTDDRGCKDTHTQNCFLWPQVSNVQSMYNQCTVSSCDFFCNHPLVSVPSLDTSVARVSWS